MPSCGSCRDAKDELAALGEEPVIDTSDMIQTRISKLQKTNKRY